MARKLPKIPKGLKARYNRMIRNMEREEAIKERKEYIAKLRKALQEKKLIKGGV